MDETQRKVETDDGGEVEEELAGHAVWSFLLLCSALAHLMPPVSLTTHTRPPSLNRCGNANLLPAPGPNPPNLGRSGDESQKLLAGISCLVRTLKYITQKSLLFIAPTLDALAMKSYFYNPWQISPNHTSSCIESFEQE
jgi:hypothetical protein